MRPLHALLCIGAIASSIDAASTGYRLSLSPIAPVKPTIYCPFNQVYKECKGCELRCEDIAARRICPDICIPGCTCADGFVKNPDDICVRQEECPDPYKPFPELPLEPSPETCSDTEEYKECKGCDQTCDNPNGPIACPRICLQGCACKAGYVRDDEGKCIPPLQCKKTDPVPVPITYPPYPEPPQPVNADSCDAPVAGSDKCPVNEEFSTCLPCNQECPGFGSNICPYICKSGCACKPGFSRSPGGGKCIPTIQCPQIDPVPIRYPPYPEPPQVDVIEPFPEPPHIDPFPDTYPQYPGPPEVDFIGPFPEPPHVDPFPDTYPQPPPVAEVNACPFNEEYTECGGCEETCESLNTPMACAAVCIVGCQCKKGYVRENGVCISSHQCPLIDPVPVPFDPYPNPNPYPYPNKYPHPHHPHPHPHPLPPQVEVIEPFPEPPYIDPYPIAYPPYPEPPQVDDDCDDPVDQADTCPPDEVFTDCLPCNEQCPGFGPDVCTLQCTSGCACKPGYSRMEGGGCIPNIQCPQIDPYPEPPYPEPPQVDETCEAPVDQINTCPANEVFTDCLPCNEQCPGFGPDVCTLQCTSGCACKPGYSRVEEGNGACIPSFQCPQIDPPYPYPEDDTSDEEEPYPDFELPPLDTSLQTCGVNEHYTTCGGCEETCQSLIEPLICATVCVVGCQCLPGYVRENGECIEASQCAFDFSSLGEPLIVDEPESDFNWPTDEGEIFTDKESVILLPLTEEEPVDIEEPVDEESVILLPLTEDEPVGIQEPFTDEESVILLPLTEEEPIDEESVILLPLTEEEPIDIEEPFTDDESVILLPLPEEEPVDEESVILLPLTEEEPSYIEEPLTEEEPVDIGEPLTEEEPGSETCPVNEEFRQCKGCDQTCSSLNNPIMCNMICIPGCSCKEGFVRKDGVCVAPTECPAVSSIPAVEGFEFGPDNQFFTLPEGFEFGTDDIVYTLPEGFDFDPNDVVYTLPEDFDIADLDMLPDFSLPSH